MKCAAEHVRLASSLEQISAGAWEEAISECIHAALHDRKLLEERRQEHDRQKAAQEQEVAEPPVPLAADGGLGLASAAVSAPSGGLDLPLSVRLN